ncbi:ribokinase [Bacillus niameyensis]|uniref:ribokinase n=1 Tax=Bacillus niameyensis TaxID=1522308 RepID=UPI0007856D9F|nr:ribokinase [Bacillus niameyensis]
MAQNKITIIGSMNMDIVVEAPRFPLGGETITGNRISFIPGGKGANQAVAAARLGAVTTMIGAVGEDSFGETLLDYMEKDDVNVENVKLVKNESTGTASITLVPNENNIVVVPGANGQLLPEDIRQYENVIADSDIILLQLEIPLATIEEAVDIADRYHKTIILNPAPAQKLPKSVLNKIHYITPNESELETLTGLDRSQHSLDEMMDVLLDWGCRYVVTTLGSEGVAWKGKGEKLEKVPSHSVSVVDTTGAGDAFNAGLAYFLCTEHKIDEAIISANQVSALAVTKFGAQAGMPTLQEVQKFFGQQR